jgi:hypothetical protein
MTPQELAVFFHETYERLAPRFGYETRPDTKAFDPQSPNGKLMTEVAACVLTRLAAEDHDVRAIDTVERIGLSSIAALAERVESETERMRNTADVTIDPRWLSLAITQFQTAFMSLRRSIFSNSAKRM